MWSPRNAVVVASLIFVAAIISAWVALLQTPDSGGVGHDTYGVRGYGYRGLVDTVRELGFVVRRQLAPPQPKQALHTLVCVEPSPALLRTHPTYLVRMKDWVAAGGRLVVVMPLAVDLQRDFMSTCRACGKDCDLKPTDLLDLIGLDGVSVHSPALNALLLEDQQNTGAGYRSPSERVTDWDSWVEAAKSYEVAITEVSVKATGTFNDAAVSRLAVEAKSIQYLDCSNTTPIGTITLAEDLAKTRSQVTSPIATQVEKATNPKTEGAETVAANEAAPAARVLAAEFSHGAGSIVVIADPSLLRNRTFPLADNSVLAVTSLGSPDRQIIFDEYYHGLSASGNPLFLLTRPGFAALALGILAIVGAVLWRQAVWLGPPIDPSDPPRRDIAEFLTAMGRLYAHNSQSRPLLAKQCRAGVVRQLSGEVGLPPDQQDVALVGRLLARRNEPHSDLFLRTIADVDQELRSTRFWTESQSVRTIRKLTACLSIPT